RPGDMLFKLEGEKSVEEVEAFDAGVLSIPADAPKEGDRVAVGAVLGWLLQAGESANSSPPAAVEGLGVRGTGERNTPHPPEPTVPATSPTRGEVGVAVGVARVTEAERRTAPTSPLVGEVAAPSGARAAGGGYSDRNSPPISPRARRLAEQHDIDWTRLNGTGSTGRIRERDVAAVVPTAGDIPLSPIRRTTAARLVESRQHTAPVTLFASADATNLVNLREQFKAAGGVVPAYTDFLLKLVAVVLQQHPILAARWTDAGLKLAARIDIGLAVDTGAGLLVPVVRDVPALDLRQLTEVTRGLIARARRGELTAREMDGGCFTVTSLGAFGVEFFTPIINYPECAILGVGAIRRVPVMDGDRVVAREQLPLSLTFDHRVVDGAPAARFLRAVCELVEAPGPSLGL
ncbi:MAG: dihydrolipoamide acetyltransferase family protein, partial [Gemmataceae bacterium]